MDESEGLVCAHVSHSTSEAQVIVTMLKAYGIAAVVQGGEFIGNYPQLASAKSGMPILVAREARRDAQQLIDEFKSANP